MKLTLTTARGPIVVEVFDESVDVSGAYEALNGTYLGGSAEVIRVLVTAIEDLHYLVFFPCCVERLLGGPEGLLSRAAPREDPPPREDPERVFAKLVLALRLARPGQLLFVEQEDAARARDLPMRLWRHGVARPFLHLDFSQQRLWRRGLGCTTTCEERLLPLEATGSLPVYLQTLLARVSPARDIEVLYLGGLASRLVGEPAPGGELERLTLARAALASLGVVLVFLVPPSVVQLLRTAAVNLWTWRSHHAVLVEPADGPLFGPE